MTFPPTSITCKCFRVFLFASLERYSYVATKMIDMNGTNEWVEECPMMCFPTVVLLARPTSSMNALNWTRGRGNHPREKKATTACRSFLAAGALKRILIALLTSMVSPCHSSCQTQAWRCAFSMVLRRATSWMNLFRNRGVNWFDLLVFSFKNELFENHLSIFDCIPQ